EAVDLPDEDEVHVAVLDHLLAPESRTPGLRRGLVVLLQQRLAARQVRFRLLGGGEPGLRPLPAEIGQQLVQRDLLRAAAAVERLQRAVEVAAEGMPGGHPAPLEAAVVVEEVGARAEEVEA